MALDLKTRSFHAFYLIETEDLNVDKKIMVPLIMKDRPLFTIVDTMNDTIHR